MFQKPLNIPKQQVQGNDGFTAGFPVFISLIRACVANEILKWVGCVREGGGGSPQNCRWGCDVPFFKW